MTTLSIITLKIHTHQKKPQYFPTMFYCFLNSFKQLREKVRTAALKCIFFKLFVVNVFSLCLFKSCAFVCLGLLL